MANYGSFSDYYDSLMQNVDYQSRANYIFALFLKFDKTPSLLLDLGCGTGSFTKIFYDKGIDVIGVDPSADMLSEARAKCPEALYLMQSGDQLDLYGTVDGAVSLTDSLNHITDYALLCETFKKVSLFLEKDRLFIFDVNTLYKHKEILKDNAFVFENDEVFCTWQNSTDENALTDIRLDFFNKDGDVYSRSFDEFSERGYSVDDITAAVTDAGLEIVAIYDNLTELPARENSERLYFVTRKV